MTQTSPNTSQSLQTSKQPDLQARNSWQVQPHRGSHVDHLSLNHSLPSGFSHPALGSNHPQRKYKPGVGISHLWRVSVVLHCLSLVVCRRGGWCHQRDKRWSSLTCGTPVTPPASQWPTAIHLTQVRRLFDVFICVYCKCLLSPCCCLLPQATCRQSRPPWSWPPSCAASASSSSSFSSSRSNRERGSFSPQSSNYWPVSETHQPSTS